MSAMVWIQQSVMYCGMVLPASRQMLATSNVSNVSRVDTAVRHALRCSVKFSTLLRHSVTASNGSLLPGL